MSTEGQGATVREQGGGSARHVLGRVRPPEGAARATQVQREQPASWPGAQLCPTSRRSLDRGPPAGPAPPPRSRGAAPSPRGASGPDQWPSGCRQALPCLRVSKFGDVLLRTLGTCSLQPPQPTGGEAPHKPSETALKRRPGPNEARNHPAGPRGPLTRCTRSGAGGQTL